jgi:hypothetical protein
MVTLGGKDALVINVCMLYNYEDEDIYIESNSAQ